METTEQLKFTLAPEVLEEGAPEEKAGFGMVTIAANGHILTEGIALLENNALFSGPHVSGYHMAEWLLWNWWRLLWEPRPAGVDNDDDNDDTWFEWVFAHNLSSIGEGYLWPDIEMASDGVLMHLASSPTEDPNEKVFRYVGTPRFETITVETFKKAVDEFAHVVLERLGGANIPNTNLHAIWRHLELERNGEAAAAFRRMEAILGHDPGKGDDDEIRGYLADAATLGQDAVAELAAHTGQGKERPIHASKLIESAHRVGFDARARDAVQIDSKEGIPDWGTCKAWRIGSAMARTVRRSGSLNGQPINNARLSELAGVSKRVIKNISKRTDHIAFELDDENGHSRIALRSEWETGRRFDLARLLADRLCMNDLREPLHPATQSYTYRQKVQRAFAIELLAPIAAVDDFLDGDTSQKRQKDAAGHFNVSEKAMWSLLVNNHRVSREEALDTRDRM